MSLISLMVVALTVSTQLTTQEKKAVDKMTKDGVKNQISHKAADTIKFSLKLLVELRRRSGSTCGHNQGQVRPSEIKRRDDFDGRGERHTQEASLPCGILSILRFPPSLPQTRRTGLGTWLLEEASL